MKEHAMGLTGGKLAGIGRKLFSAGAALLL